jgi:nucleotide-binding universal stress UspA family protein
MANVADRADVQGGVVVGHDGSEPAARATRWAARLAVLLDVPLHVVRAWSLTSAPRPKTAAPGYEPPITDFEQAVREQLEAHVAGLDLPEACQVNCHVVHAAPARALLQAAERAELLVVAARGTGGFRGLMFGSTADQVTRHAPCAVTIVPAG